MRSELKIYPSGFLGNGAVAQTEAADPIQTAKKIFDNSPRNDINRYTANREIVRLWSLMSAGDKQVKTLAFKADVIEAALVAFGCTSLLEWIEIQQSNLNYTDNQARWIDETLNYVYASHARRINNYAWLTVVRMGSGLPAKKTQSEVVRSLLLTNSLVNPRSGSTIREFVIAWCRKPGGIYDLLSSLNVLFGTR